jgi:hypothetical protein
MTDMLLMTCRMTCSTVCTTAAAPQSGRVAIEHVIRPTGLVRRRGDLFCHTRLPSLLATQAAMCSLALPLTHIYHSLTLTHSVGKDVKVDSTASLARSYCN